MSKFVEHLKYHLIAVDKARAIVAEIATEFVEMDPFSGDPQTGTRECRFCGAYEHEPHERHCAFIRLQDALEALDVNDCKEN